MEDINVIVDNANFKPNEDLKVVMFENEPVVMVPTTKTMIDVLVDHGFFPSKAQARKNWTVTGVDIPPGFNIYRIGKLKRKLCIWNPS